MKGRSKRNSTYLLNRYENRKFWTAQEDQIIHDSILEIGCDWKKIAVKLEGRNASQCAQRWKRIKPKALTYRNNKWTPEEDQLVINHVQNYGQRWNYIASHLKNRTGRQVRERFLNSLDGNLKKGNWTQDEDKLIWSLYMDIGTKWSKMAKTVVGRSENMIKNRFYSFVRSKYGNIMNPYYEVTMGSCETQNNSEGQHIVVESKYKLRKQHHKQIYVQDVDKASPFQTLETQKSIVGQTIDLKYVSYQGNEEEQEYSIDGQYSPPKIINYSTDDLIVFPNNLEQDVQDFDDFEQSAKIGRDQCSQLFIF